MISAVVLAAGLSTRMRRPKLVLPWGSTTVIGQVVTTLAQAQVDDIVVVTGAARTEVEAALEQGRWDTVRTVFNPRYSVDNMLVSLQAGIAALGKQVDAILVALGDQPQIEVGVVGLLVDTYRTEGYPLIVPSFHMRRGHPWVVARTLWPDLLSAPDSSTMRDFLHAHTGQITYIAVSSSSILGDLDTPEDYARDHGASQ
jgi:molybdenum cofactor cytidylyltransferase